MASKGLKKILITGPESSGKTTLARQIATHLDCPYVPEFARIYLESQGASYSYEQLDEMARGQAELVQMFARNNVAYLVEDTSFISLYIWSLEKFGKVSSFIEDGLENMAYYRILLCAPDIKWTYDELRENPLDRDYLFDLYKLKLGELGLEYGIIQGVDELRFKGALSLLGL